VLARFERLMEQAVEGSLRRIFPTTLQPIQLAKAAARAMEQSQVVGRRGADVPNLYELRLASADLRRFEGYTETLRAEIRAYLLEYARERGLRPVADLRVEVIDDPSVRTGSVQARARFDGLSSEVQREVEDGVAGTRRLRLADLDAARQQRAAIEQSRLRLTDAAGLDEVLEPSTEVVRIGRAVDNDIVLASKNVSRYHAQLRWVATGWLVYDLDSTNGTWLDEQRLSQSAPALLYGGSRLRLGDYDIAVVLEDAATGAQGRRGRT
jgi:hypothetical protein